MNALTPPVSNELLETRQRGRSAIPESTYRLQLHKEFGFADATARVDYFAQLGVSHLYLSPIQTARAGSMHGYDVVDHRAINPELGGELELHRLSEACHKAGLGIIADIVPNHMAVGGADNSMWLDVLENGASSQYANVFDIEFSNQDAALSGKVVVPVLGEPYGDALTDGKLILQWDADLRKLTFAYGPHRFPLRPQDYPVVAGDQTPSQADLAHWRDPQRLHKLLEQQNFRLTWWNAAGDIINWRRFFDVNELAALRMEEESVFRLTHEVILRLYGEGVLDGVRVDHVDGLADPASYLQRLQTALAERTIQRPGDCPKDGPYIVIEKILGSGEELPRGWKIHGTTGYDFMDQVNALQHDPAGEAILDELWAEISGRPDPFNSEETAARIEVLQGGFAGQLAACAASFADMAQSEIDTRDLTMESFRRALVSFISKLRRYRSYATGTDPSIVLDPAVENAILEAKVDVPADAASLDFLSSVLTQRTGSGQTAAHAAIRKLNQLTAPVAAKAVEDTAFYRYSRLLSRNDVGFDAARFSINSDEFLASGRRRVAHWGRAMLTTATHDHKRGEDVRARLAVVSEVPELWRDNVRHWLALTADSRPEAVTMDDAYALFQTLVGSWPINLNPNDAEGIANFSARIAQWRQKSLREAKQRSSWAAPDVDYENASAEWLKQLMTPKESAAFLSSMAEFVARIAPAGAINSVVQSALRCAWPGVPDLYQGAELWDFSLVDPDNRRPVDFASRQQLLDANDHAWESGAIKQSTIARLLNWRRSEPGLFCEGELAPLPVRGLRQHHILAFSRRSKSASACVAAMLHVGKQVFALGEMPSAHWWSDTAVQINDSWIEATKLFDQAPVYAALGP